MLRNFVAALVATALVAGPAFAAQPAQNAGAPTVPAITQTPAQQTDAKKPVKTVKHARSHVRHRVAHAAKPVNGAKSGVRNTKSSA